MISGNGLAKPYLYNSSLVGALECVRLVAALVFWRLVAVRGFADARQVSLQQSGNELPQSKELRCRRKGIARAQTAKPSAFQATPSASDLRIPQGRRGHGPGALSAHSGECGVATSACWLIIPQPPQKRPARQSAGADGGDTVELCAICGAEFRRASQSFFEYPDAALNGVNAGTAMTLIAVQCRLFGVISPGEERGALDPPGW
jgi:hypothetical protein